MKKNKNRKAFQFLLKLFMLIQLNSYLKFTAEATQLSSTKENVGQLDQTNGENLNDRMSQMEAKSRRQENAIYFLKAAIVEDKRAIRQLRARVSSLESFMLTKNQEPNDQLLLRQKRPYRLLHAHPDGDKMENEKALVNTRFYGPASNCNELGKLGFTLNGYYLVKGKDESISNSIIEAVLCQFNLPEGSKDAGINEERLGLVTIKKNVEKPMAHRKENHMESYSTQETTTKNELKVTERNFYGFVSSMDGTTTAKPFGDRRSKIAQPQGKIRAQPDIQHLPDEDEEEIESQNENVITKGLKLSGVRTQSEIRTPAVKNRLNQEGQESPMQTEGLISKGLKMYGNMLSNLFQG